MMRSAEQPGGDESGAGRPIITLLTDFGSTDYFVPAVKGVILSINPEARLIDLTHEVPAHDIAAGSFILGASYGYYPPRTIHLAVVDPGVGSTRRAIVVATPQALFVAPDNGLLTGVYDNEPEYQVYDIGERWRAAYLRRTISPTFHGRDLFAPVAAWLSRGLPPAELGELVSDPVRLPRPPAGQGIHESAGQLTGQLVGQIIHIDRYGNGVTSLGLSQLPFATAAECGLEVAGQPISLICRYFSEAAGSTEPFAYPGSAGYWEIGCWCDSAARRLGIQRGAVVLVPGRPVGAEQ
ncbi:MAG: S-adenosyl-l-methionine hydroxide adenosyltransferase family protein [Acidobacteriota bacterium]|jgi:hypothetical protein